MDPSRMNLSAAVVVALLVMTAEMAPAQAVTCKHLSGKFRGWCLLSDHCAEVCKTEGKGYTGGLCLGALGIILRCYCLIPCTAAVPAGDKAVELRVSNE
ncbi:hypothetical protein HU200_018543 [Digitaria exilis]|uniref:Knottins-like domain-containing protein n=1 Tax=Digitaria exilis TaxID=1010633 RepID=A0A835F4B3_9POAL|nr:hypothetical protein HU200_018543 [Digitaria exilis]CAB3500276.1 unnamed protein product [Digitaria exilis]CAB3504287.1 unnamed protein product [Digitaria exilis]